MPEFPNLRIDKMKVDTSLAKSYFSQNKFTFNFIGVEDNDTRFEYKHISDGHNKIYSIINIEAYLPSIPPKTSNYVCDYDCNLKLIQLKSKINDNAKLFSQIEYLLRKISIDEVLNYDIKLMIQNISYNVANSTPLHIPNTNVLLMGTTTPLANLGFVVQMLKAYEDAYILSCASTAAACNLFIELCHEAGFSEVKLINCEDRLLLPNTINLCADPWIMSGCVGVITENADVESAVDVLLETTTQYPWKLKHILVQENVYKIFKKALRWKTRDSSPATNELCVESFDYKDKSFLLDYVGSENVKNITVEAYRTTKELLALLEKSNYFYMSIWTNNLSESNEITHNSNIDIIWINDFGVFNGPPMLSQAIYKNIGQSHDLKKINDTRPANEDVLEIQKQWLQLPFCARLDIIHDFLNQALSYTHATEFQTVKDDLENFQSDSFMSVHKGQICVCTLKPLYSTFTYIKNDCRFNLLSLVKELLIGGLILIAYPEFDGNMATFLTELNCAGAPVFLDESKFIMSHAIDTVVNLVKVVHSNYGSIFAN